jgi:hypothetical protein
MGGVGQPPGVSTGGYFIVRRLIAARPTARPGSDSSGAAHLDRHGKSATSSSTARCALTHNSTGLGTLSLPEKGLGGDCHRSRDSTRRPSGPPNRPTAARTPRLTQTVPAEAVEARPVPAGAWNLLAPDIYRVEGTSTDHLILRRAPAGQWQHGVSRRAT